ncbi:Cathepsin_B [Hexamita inflata]|uniref:Cathepsin_B n=1 Tax=Hexamita inflata TaxID=28002 RepID=A0ABP1L698_9EUKA
MRSDYRCLQGKDSERIEYSPQYTLNCNQLKIIVDVVTKEYMFFEIGIIQQILALSRLSCISYKSGVTGKTNKCPTTCDDGSQLPTLVKANDVVIICDSDYDNKEAIKQALANGPVSTQICVYEDLYYYEKKRKWGKILESKECLGKRVGRKQQQDLQKIMEKVISRKLAFNQKCESFFYNIIELFHNLTSEKAKNSYKIGLDNNNVLQHINYFKLTFIINFYNTLRLNQYYYSRDQVKPVRTCIKTSDHMRLPLSPSLSLSRPWYSLPSEPSLSLPHSPLPARGIPYPLSPPFLSLTLPFPPVLFPTLPLYVLNCRPLFSGLYIYFLQLQKYDGLQLCESCQRIYDQRL